MHMTANIRMLPFIGLIVLISLSVVMYSTGVKVALTRNVGFVRLVHAQVINSMSTYAAAEMAFQEVLHLKPADKRVQYGLGMLYFQKKDYVHAVRLLSALVSPTKEGFVLANYHLGRAYRALGQDKKAVDAWRSVPDLPGFLLKEARRFREEGALDQAVELYTTIASLSPAMGEAYCGAGEALQAMGRVTEAEKWLRAGLEDTVFITPGSSPVDCAAPLVYLLLGEGRREEARDIAKEAVNSEPANSRAWLVLGVALQDTDVDAARLALLHSIQLDAKQLWAYLHLSDIARARQCLWEALGWANQAASLYPDSEWAAQRQGQAYFALGLLPQAAEAFERGIELNPDEPQLWADLADVHIAQGNVEAGILEYQHAILLSPTTPYYHRRLGDAYLRIGLSSQADSEYQQALELESK